MSVRAWRPGTGTRATIGKVSLAPPGHDQYALLEAWVRAHATAESLLLDIGAGDGDQPYPSNLAGSVARIVGIDPDAGIHRNERVHERVQASLEDFAATSAQRFDLAVAVYVVEHVVDPLAFASAMYRSLRPGGSAFLLTPSRWHYFGATALLARRLRVDEWLLSRRRDDAVLHEHHFPIQYRLNSRRAIHRVAGAAGFRSVEFQMIDEPGIYQPYFPAPLRAVPAWYSGRVHRHGWEGLAGTILARLEK
jgi:SAM-dependent methyltransferase